VQICRLKSDDGEELSMLKRGLNMLE